MKGQYYTAKWGPGKCRNGHDKPAPGRCPVCDRASLERKLARDREARRLARGTRLTADMVAADVAAMRERVAARRRLEARRKSVAA